MRLAALLALLVLLPLAAAAPAAASEPLADRSVSRIGLKANAKGEALVTYRRADGRVRRVLVWGAVNARHPDPGRPQVRFRYDYAGGWGKYRRMVWKSFRNVCGPYRGPALPHLVTACTAPDGSHWALQSWQRGLPLLGRTPARASERAWELHVSHWTGPLPELFVSANWTYGGGHVGLFGRLTYLGRPVHGFRSTPSGNPRDRYSRNVYIDTYGSAYGAGWKRRTGILTHRPTGTFCHSFVPMGGRPGGRGSRYRVTVMGPGVTPVVRWEGPGLGRYDAARDRELNALFDRVMAGDEICRPER